MRRECSLEEISDGKRYGLNDLVKVGCNDCEGCSDCCRGMGNSIVLDPYDVYRLGMHLGANFQQMVQNGWLELNMVDGLILPNLKMNDSTMACTFLNEQGRCSIHAHRPGICRIFPLGRLYENNGFSYILQVGECERNRTKIKVNKWIDTPDLKKNQQFIAQWHEYIKNVGELIRTCGSEDMAKQMTMYVLGRFYQVAYDSEKGFYEQIEERMAEAKLLLQELGY